MPVTTTHQYIDQYRVKPSDTRMIVGTIHPHLHDNFQIPFFYGNVGSFWDLLQNAFPHLNLNSREGILEMLNQNNIWITDIIKSCDRANEGVTNDNGLYNIIPNTDQIRDALIKSRIDTIYFTSRFDKNNAARLFTHHFNIPYAESFDENLSEFVIPSNHFGREIRCVVLYSPSNAANIGVSRSHPYRNNRQHYQQFDKPVKQFKIDFYREKFQFLSQN